MGKAARWFRKLLGLKKPSESSSSSSQQSGPLKDKRRWSFVRSPREPPPVTVADRTVERLSENKDRAAGVQLITAEDRAAVSTASHGGLGTGCRRKRELDGADAAAVVIQSAFRGYLARRALRALRGLVKIQALVRGYIVRKKRTAEWLCQMQALLRAQARARTERALNSESSRSSSKCSLFTHPGPATPEKLEPSSQGKSMVRDRSPVLRKSGSSSKAHKEMRLGWTWSDEQGPSTGSSRLRAEDKILEVDSGNIVRSSSHLHRTSRSFAASKDSSYSEAQSAYPVGLLLDDAEDEPEFRTANNSPQFYSAPSRNPNSRRSSPFTPSKSDDTRSYFGGYSDYPNYMSYTESSRAKVRSVSAPRHRPQPQFEKSASGKRNSMHGFGESRSASQKSSAVFTNFAYKGYPGSGRLDRHGMPIRG